MESSRLDELLASFTEQRILVIGDLMLDEFLWGKVTRISPEAPVPVLDVQRRALYPGGAANVARNLASLAHDQRDAGTDNSESIPAKKNQVSVAGIVGDDEPGRRLISLLQDQSVGTNAIRQSPLRPTTHKTRVCAITRQLHSHLDIEDQQQIVRVDEESRAPLDAKSREWLADQLSQEIATHDAVILEDYGKGLIDQSLVSEVIREATRLGKPVAVDPNPTNPLNWSGSTVLKPNRKEAFYAAGLPMTDSNDAILAAGQKLLQHHEVKYLLITLGEAGMLLLERGQEPYWTPTRAQEVYDVSGAGDTAIAAFTLALAAGATGIEAAELANHAAGVVVGKLGTATLSRAELKESFKKTNGNEHLHRGNDS